MEELALPTVALSVEPEFAIDLATVLAEGPQMLAGVGLAQRQRLRG